MPYPRICYICVRPKRVLLYLDNKLKEKLVKLHKTLRIIFCHKYKNSNFACSKLFINENYGNFFFKTREIGNCFLKNPIKQKKINALNVQRSNGLKLWVIFFLKHSHLGIHLIQFTRYFNCLHYLSIQLACFGRL